MNNLLENLRSDSIENNYKVIFTSPTYKTLSNYPKDQIKGGDSSMFVADLVVMFNGGVVKIVKSRFGIDNETISLNGI